MNLKILINILTTNSLKDRQKSILDTWLHGYSDYVFYTDQVNNNGNQISVTDKSSYEYCGLKQINRFKQILSNKEYLNYDFFLFCDDDTVVNIKNILKLIQTLDVNFIHGHVLNGSWDYDKNLKYCSGGAGFIVPSNLLKLVKKQPILYPYDDGIFHPMFGWSDVQSGLFFRDNNFICKNLPKFYYDQPQKFNLNENDPNNHEEIKQSYTFHYIKTHEQRQKITQIFNQI